ncbi:flagellar motor switch protein FliN [Salinibacterium sp. ZJ454]|uniref:flagellar motor switch protein FliN n=1 Tax=Salinibacterium sp. ZJ454 TaxID=2708339 RepID=UPI0014201078|nr:flagellar motor switch protein FliN [Salinibacterium sp. ZJ454]
MSTTTTPHAAAADALIALLPSQAPLTAVQADRSRAVGAVHAATVATFVGAESADLAVVLNDAEALAAAAGTDSPLVSAADVLRPALENAASVFGTGVLGEARIDDASALFADTDSRVFELTADGATAGWFAIRVRSTGTRGTAAPTTADARSVADKLGRINNVEMALTVEIGRTRMSVRDVLDLEPGAVIELDRSAGAPADILLNGRLIAHGEVVVVDQDYAVRITQILDVTEGLA